MGEKKQDNGSFGLVVFGYGVLIVWLAYLLLGPREAPAAKPCQCKPTPAPCCKADECRKELAQVDARFGDVWDELVEVQEQLAKVKPCDCGPSKSCECDLSKTCPCPPSKSCECSKSGCGDCSKSPRDKPACECKPPLTAAPAIKENAPKLNKAPACGRRARR